MNGPRIGHLTDIIQANHLSRRQALKTAATGLASAAVAPACAMGGTGGRAARHRDGRH